MSKDYKDLIVGLDIGTAKITCLVAEARQDGRLAVIGLGSQPSHGLRKGVVVNAWIYGAKSLALLDGH